MTIESAIAMLRAKIEAVVNAYNREVNLSAALRKENADLKDSLASAIVALANDIPSLDSDFPNSNH